MEVLSFITSNKSLIDKFESFLLDYNGLILSNKDLDTMYFKSKKTGKIELYFHFLADVPENEFSYNYSSEEKYIIKNHFGDNDLTIFDIQYNNEKFLEELLVDFKDYLLQQETEFEILLSHPFKGITRF